MEFKEAQLTHYLGEHKLPRYSCAADVGKNSYTCRLNKTAEVMGSFIK